MWTKESVMRTIDIAIKTVAIGVGTTLLASGLAFAAISAAPQSAHVHATEIGSDAVTPFTVAQGRSRGNPYNSFDNTSGGWMNGGNTG